MMHVVGIGDIVISSDVNDSIVTHALGSCVAVTFHCPQTKVTGMIHIALPSRSTGQLINGKPGYYADEGLFSLINTLESHYQFRFGTAEINVFGGAIPSKTPDIFKIGTRNLQAVDEILRSKNLRYQAYEVGGVVSRTIELSVKNGEIKIKRQPLII